MNSSSTPRIWVTAAARSFARPLVGQLRVGHARVGLAGRLLHVAGTLEPFEQPRDPRGRQQHALRQVDPPHHEAVGVREVQQHLVVVQRQPVLALELSRQLARDRCMSAQERHPAGQIRPGYLEGGHSCALKCSARRGPRILPIGFSICRRAKQESWSNGSSGSSRTSGPSTASTCRSSPARSTASSARTAPASRRPCTC